MNEEQDRINSQVGNPDGWRHWGPYLSERAWGTVREDYSPDGSAWDYFPHDHARSRAYRWNEDGLGGICDIRQNLCFAVALWNGHDPILKERIFGLTGPQGNHGEDVKEYYFYLDAAPSHSYLKFLYKYPHAAFPYDDLIRTNASRNRNEPEYELLDTGVFDDNRYFDVFVEYTRETPEDICIRITAHNRGPEPAPLHILPTFWCRNMWRWDGTATKMPERVPQLCLVRDHVIRATHYRVGKRYLFFDAGEHGLPEMLFCDNETNNERLFQTESVTRYPKDSFHTHVIGDNPDAVNPNHLGTKSAGWYKFVIPAGESVTVKLRLRDDAPTDTEDVFAPAVFDDLFAKRIAETDAFYAKFTPSDPALTFTDDAKAVQRQAYAGLIWSKQFYHYDVYKWLHGDPAQPAPPTGRVKGRNSTWQTAHMRDVISMPDKWEYPWFAAWDLAFHMIPFAQIDPDFAKHQLILLCREWYMHPNGQLPAYEWAFSDVNPPVHAWAALRIYKIERSMQGKGRDEMGDTNFLERVFHKLLINFTWWVNRKDAQGNNIFEGGFLGLDNIGVFDRSAPLPNGGFTEQCDGTAWMAMFCLNMLAIALELSRVDPTYSDVATKFAEHFVYIAHALNDIGDDGYTLWDERDGFFYDILHAPMEADSTNEQSMRLKIRSMVGLIPLFAVEAFDADVLAAVPDFVARLEWFLREKPNLAKDVAHMNKRGQQDRVLFSLVGGERLRRILRYVFDENEFLSPHGLRSVSKFHKDHPYTLDMGGKQYRVDYTPAESTTGLFGGNSNWRGPIWFPLNFLLVEALQKFDYVYGSEFYAEFPTGSGCYSDLWEISGHLSRRMSSLFVQGPDGTRPIYGGETTFQSDPHWRDCILFHEYFHGDNGAGLGASHQTGWTALVAKLLSQNGV